MQPSPLHVRVPDHGRVVSRHDRVGPQSTRAENPTQVLDVSDVKDADIFGT